MATQSDVPTTNDTMMAGELERLAQDAAAIVVRFLNCAALARLCECSGRLSRNLDRAQFWLLVRPGAERLLKPFALASFAGARRIHSIYGIAHETKLKPFDLRPFGGTTVNYVPGWLRAYFITMHVACKRGLFDKMRWVHSLYAGFDPCTSAPIVAEGMNARTVSGATRIAVRALVATACASGNVEMAQWAATTLDPDMHLQLTMGFVLRLLNESIKNERPEITQWVVRHYEPTLHTVVDALCATRPIDALSPAKLWLEEYYTEATASASQSMRSARPACLTRCRRRTCG